MVERNEYGEVRAAGGVVRRVRDGHLEVLLVHRPHHADWTLPKGKADAGESDESCALREVEEETGMLCDLGDELPPVRYTDGYGRPKVVRYWLMEPRSGTFVPTGEVDAVEWLGVGDATRRLSHEHDKQLMQTVQDLPSAGR